MDKQVLIHVILHIWPLWAKIGMQLASNKHEGTMKYVLLPRRPSYVYTSCALSFWNEARWTSRCWSMWFCIFGLCEPKLRCNWHQRSMKEPWRKFCYRVARLIYILAALWAFGTRQEGQEGADECDFAYLACVSQNCDAIGIKQAWRNDEDCFATASSFLCIY